MAGCATADIRHTPVPELQALRETATGDVEGERALHPGRQDVAPVRRRRHTGIHARGTNALAFARRYLWLQGKRNIVTKLTDRLQMNSMRQVQQLRAAALDAFRRGCA